MSVSELSAEAKLHIAGDLNSKAGANDDNSDNCIADACGNDDGGNNILLFDACGNVRSDNGYNGNGDNDQRDDYRQHGDVLEWYRRFGSSGGRRHRGRRCACCGTRNLSLEAAPAAQH